MEIKQKKIEIFERVKVREEFQELYCVGDKEFFEKSEAMKYEEKQKEKKRIAILKCEIESFEPPFMDNKRIYILNTKEKFFTFFKYIVHSYEICISFLENEQTVNKTIRHKDLDIEALWNQLGASFLLYEYNDGGDHHDYEYIDDLRLHKKEIVSYIEKLKEIKFLE